ncbi:mono-functional DNA-alkylating methyl methanesulfonate N-term-domain-containing protein [Nemania diffusa]|nr:mono-functional DNA-alkylating methyl methanesulfonate N-term-domain-containing protein [Nemania diffusa]
MASIQTQVWLNNQWVTQTVSTQELIGSSRSHAKPVLPGPPTPPKYGVLTKTIIESPIIHWALPVQLRSPRFNDVALVGDQSVQICELGTDVQLLPIARKLEFGSRIRNCRVIGTNEYLVTLKNIIRARSKSDDRDTERSKSPTPATFAGHVELFQQVLVLVLSEELVFLIMSLTAAGDWEFVASHYSIFSEHLEDPGFLMTISPDGGYLALACSERLFIVYELESIEELRRQHKAGLSIQPIRSKRARGVKGVVHKLEFLHPDPENLLHTVLLIMTVQSGVIRQVIYDWENVAQLQDALKMEKPGHMLDGTTGLPLLIIPLTVSCQFIVITERSMAICTDILSGPPVFRPFEISYQKSTNWHHGTHPPLWTAWTRPMREELYHADTDLVFIAREDGWLNCLEIKRNSGIYGSIYLGPLECSIDSGFASISTTYGEVLIAGGNYGPGAIWMLEARQNPKRLGLLSNWSPTSDLVLAKDVSAYSKSDLRKSSKRPLLAKKAQNRRPAPERVFACSGRDLSGAIVELRHGIEAKIGLDLSYTSPIKKCWVIPSFGITPSVGFCMLLSLLDNSALLHISHDLSKVSEKTQDEVEFDLLSTTLAVLVSKDAVIQITTTHATIVSPTSCYQHSISDMIEGPEDPQDPSATVTDSAITDETLALSVYSRSSFKIIVFKFNGTGFVRQRVFNVEGEVTSLSVNTLSAGVCVLAGLSQSNLPTLAIFPIGSPQSEGQALIGISLGDDEDDDPTVINAVTSIVCHNDKKILVGMRNGCVLTICSTGQSNGEFKVARTNHFGVSPSHVFTGILFDTSPSTLVCNDAGLALMKESDGKPSLGCFERIFRVWLTDANEPHLSSPSISSVARLQGIPDYGDSTWAMVSGEHILITELQPHPAPVPRYMPVKGTPQGILYSERLEAIVTVVAKRGVPSLHFLDPITGADISHPTRRVSDHDDEQHVDVDYITSLGNSNIKIVSLLNWRYKNKGNLYEWFVILARSGDDEGRLLVVSAEQEETTTNAGTTRRIRFWTQFYRKIRDGSPRSGTTEDHGLFLNFGKTLEYHVIEDKKVRTALKFDLPSPATCLEVVDGHLHVLTTHHSLLVLDYTSDATIKSHRMVQIYSDEFSRNGLHMMDVGPFMGSFMKTKEKQQLILVSTLSSSVYGLWSPSAHGNLKSIFRANLTGSIQRFVHGYTRPRWTKDRPRYGSLHSRSDRHDIMGLAVDGSLTQFSIIPEDAWKLLRYVQERAMASKETHLITCGYGNTESPETDPNFIAKTKMHVSGDILQRCLETKVLERIISTPAQLDQLHALLGELDPTIYKASSPMLDETRTAYENTYSFLEYYLSPAL